MLYLPIKLKLASFALAFSLLFVLSTKSSFAAQAFIKPNTGKIDMPSGLFSVYVSSTATEPEIASVDIKITYPNTLNITEVVDGQFDSYVSKDINTTTRTVTIKAVNNAGNYKSGEVKVAGIKFEPLANSGTVQINIDQTSKITGANGEDMLTEVVPSNFTLENPLGTSTGTTGTATGTETETTTTTAAPATGVNNIISSLIISALLLLGGVYLAKTSTRKK